MVAAYCIYIVTHMTGLNPLWGMLAAIVLVTLLGMISYKILLNLSVSMRRRADSNHRIGYDLSGDYVSDLHIHLFKRTVAHQRLFYHFGCKGLFSTAPDLLRSLARYGRAVGLSDEDQNGLGHPVNCSRQGSGQSHGDR